jgi:hypothetical protein
MTKEASEGVITLSFDEPWITSIEKKYKLRILEDLGESEEMYLNEETDVEETTAVHKYKVEIID